jgi:F-type H+-transporting ATPase subunit epsilon
MATSVDCDIVSAEESVFAGKVEFISLTGTLGELGITPGHTPLLSEVKPGPVHMRIDRKSVV